MATVELAPAPKLQFLDNNGNPVPGGKVFTYAAGTSTKLATYTDSTGGTQNTNPIVLDANGRGDCWMQEGKLYKITFSPSTDTDPPTNAFWTVDNVQGVTTPSDIQDGGLLWLTGVTGSNTIAGTTSGTPAALKAGQVVRWIQPTTNTTAVTLNRDSTGAKNVLKKMSGGLVALVQNDLVGSNEYEATYDGTEYVLQGQRAYAQGAAIASAATINLDTATGDYIHLTGVVTCTAITLAQGEERTTVTDGAMQFTNSASLITINGQNITSAAGDTQVWRGEAAGVVRMISYRFAGTLPGKQPTVTKLASGSGTYTTPLGATRLKVISVGGGGGGGPAGAVTSQGGNGGDTTFSTFTAGGGTGGTGGGSGGAGGVATGGTDNMPGGAGGGANTAGATAPGGVGGSSTRGGAGAGGSGAGNAGGAAATNSGSGGGGAGGGGATAGGAGGGSGGTVVAYVTAPAASYSYAIGSGGVGGVGATANGGAGAAGNIIIEEFYA